MRKINIFFLLLVLYYNSWSQNISNDVFENQKLKDTILVLDAIQSKKKIIQYWELIDYGSKKKIVEFDTLSLDVHISNPIYKNSISNSYLGNLGSPSQSNIYLKRKEISNFLFLNPYLNYIKFPYENQFISTTVPLTTLNYSHGGSRKNAENNLKVLHSRNVNPYWNVGFSYDLISAKGFYPNQKSKIYSLNLFSSYEKKQYKSYFFVNKNMISTEENGGVQADSLITDTTLNAENILVYFDDMKNKFSNVNLFMSHHYTITSLNDSVRKNPLKLIYTFLLEDSERKHYENTVDTNYFENTFVDSSSYLDFIKYRSIKNSFHIVFNYRNLDLNLGIHHENIKYEQPDYFETDTMGVQSVTKNTSQNNTGFNANFSSIKQNKLTWRLNSLIYFSGYQKGNWLFDGTLKWKNENYELNLISKISNLKPNYLFHFFEGNHQKWDNNLINEKKTAIKLNLKIPKYDFKIGAGIDIINNYVYLDTSANLRQSNNDIKILTAYADGGFNLWRFYFKQKIYYQHNSQNKIMPIPRISLYSNNYFQSQIFNKAALVRIGMDLRYNTKFFGPAYMPSIGQFYNQNQKQIGGYPYMNVYASAVVKNTTIYFMYAHFNERIGSRNFFQALHYPNNTATLKWGVKWNFFD